MAKILIVEDEYNARRLMRAMLEQLSHDVFIIKTADEALGFLENTSQTRVKPSYSSPNCCAEDIPAYQSKHVVDIIISDWHIKGSKLDGVQFLEMVRVRFSGIKTLLMTANPEDLPDIKCPILEKPFEIDDLRIMIEELMVAA